MCGIAVSLSTLLNAPPISLERLQHRGPDAQGVWQCGDGRIWLGHTRLAILDLSPAGAQPMTDLQTGNVIVFNGEIYNHLALRKQISEAERCSWNGSSDTETLLAAYRVWGRDMLERLKGMFAFAIYDARRRELFLARDRLGIKPLYYTSTGDCFQAASEVKAFGPLHDRRLSLSALASYLRFGACLEDNLLFPEVQILPAGHWMTISLESGDRRLVGYWPSARPMRSVHPEPARQVRTLLERAVEEHLLSDVPVASFQSGGIDSSVITALAARGARGKLQTFSVGFREAAFDETAVALEVARRCGSEHTRIELGEEETLAIVREAVQKMDVPSVDAINTYIVSKKVAEQGIKVALTGLGGDELFGGYPSFRDVPRLLWLARCPSAVRRGLALLGGSARRLAELPAGGVSELTNWRRVFWTEDMLASVGLPSAALRRDAAPDLPDRFAHISWIELTRYMRHLLLRDSDQMSMAVSLELRLPFLDHELVEFVLGLPREVKEKGVAIKGLLVEACQDLLPPSVYQRPKMGFALPMDAWMRGPLRDLVAMGLREATSRCGLRVRAVESLNEQFERRKLHWTRMWSLAVLGHYLNRVSGEAETGHPEDLAAASCEYSVPSDR
jgi:asparagine synthase (glutamine-hydrolysing)